MRRTIREAPSRWTLLGFSWLLVLGTIFVLHATSMEHDSPFTFLPMAVFLSILTWEVVRARIVIDAERVRFDSRLRTRRREFATADLLRYLCVEKHGWAVVAAQKATFVPVEEPWDFHAAVAEFAPKALKAKRLRTHQLPPAEDMMGLWTFDLRHPPVETVLGAALLVLLAAFMQTGLAFVVFLGLLLALRGSGRLDLTSDALVERTPFRRREIKWSEATAIFCENPKGRRSFVITAPGRGIHVPAHLARDLETIRKLVYSLPQGTLCVNFDETTWRGYRRRKRRVKRAGRRVPDLHPAPISLMKIAPVSRQGLPCRDTGLPLSTIET